MCPDKAFIPVLGMGWLQILHYKEANRLAFGGKSSKMNQSRRSPNWEKGIQQPLIEFMMGAFDSHYYIPSVSGKGGYPGYPDIATLCR
jgi:hypothetical protein